MHTLSAITLAGLASTVSAGYSITKDYGNNFFDQFNFVTGDDPTHGYVNYVDQGTASSKGYINSNDGIYIGVDSQNRASGRGRDSIRLESKDAYNQALIILDLAHMPGSISGTWPAFWTYGPNWPNNGEIDIIEGVNDQKVNYMTLHTGNSACKMETSGDASTQMFFADCDANANGNQGCGFHDADTTGYGDGFNTAGGGVYAMEHAGDIISVWKFGRGDDLSNILSANPKPSSWPKPRAQWHSTANGGCDLKTAVQQQRITFDITFCGDWAGAAYPGGLGACISDVQNNPGKFKEAFWKVNGLKVYTTDGKAEEPSSPPPPPPPPPPSSSTEVIVQPTTTSSVEIPPPNTDTSSMEPTISTTPAVSSSVGATSSDITTSVTSSAPTITSISSTDPVPTTVPSPSSGIPPYSANATSSAPFPTASGASSVDLPTPTSTDSASITNQPPPPPPPTAIVSSSQTESAVLATSTISSASSNTIAKPDIPRPTGRKAHRKQKHTKQPSSTSAATPVQTPELVSPPAPVGNSPPPPPVQSTPTGPKPITPDTPWSVIVLPNGLAGQVQQPPVKRDFLSRQHSRHFTKDV